MRVEPEDRAFLKQFYQALADEPLGAGDQRYVDLSAVRGGEDPVELMARTVEMSAGASAQLFMGFPGTGKTTEIKRLEARLEGAGYHVKHVDVAKALPWPGNTDPSELREVVRLEGRFRPAGAAGVVVLADTLKVSDSPEELFADRDALSPPGLHVVYAAPIRLAISPASAAHLRQWDGCYVLHSVAVRSRERGEARRDAAVAALTQVVAQRAPWQRLIGPEQIVRLIDASGGNIRDLLRLVADAARRARALPIDDTVVDAAIRQQATALRPMADAHLSSLARIATDAALVVAAPEEIHQAVQLFDDHLLLAYRNGEPWYDVHPLIRDYVLRRAADLSPPPSGGTRSGEVSAPPSPRQASPLSFPALARDTRVTLIAEAYRGLRKVRWTLPRGVAALAGPNGAGKTTLLDIPGLLRQSLEHDIRKAIDLRGGPGDLRNAHVDPQSPVLLGVDVDELEWRLDLSPKGAGLSSIYGETARLRGAVLLDRAAPPPELRRDDPRPLLGRFVDLLEGVALHPLVSLLAGYRLYRGYDYALEDIRRNGSQTSSDDHLHVTGDNVFSLLRNWRDRRETRDRWEFVIESLRDAFPDAFHDLDFEVAGLTVSGRILLPQVDKRLSTFFAPHGLLAGLLHLCAVASVDRGGLVAIDEPENGLHPHAIRRLMAAMRAWADERDATVLLATHAPAVLNEFKEEPDHLFVMEPGYDVIPVPVTELRNPEWLGHFSLGNLYVHGEFGAPAVID